MFSLPSIQTSDFVSKHLWKSSIQLDHIQTILIYILPAFCCIHLHHQCLQKVLETSLHVVRIPKSSGL